MFPALFPHRQESRLAVVNKMRRMVALILCATVPILFIAAKDADAPKKLMLDKFLFAPSEVVVVHGLHDQPTKESWPLFLFVSKVWHRDEIRIVIIFSDIVFRLLDTSSSPRNDDVLPCLDGMVAADIPIVPRLLSYQ